MKGSFSNELLISILAYLSFISIILYFEKQANASVLSDSKKALDKINLVNICDIVKYSRINSFHASLYFKNTSFFFLNNSVSVNDLSISCVINENN